MNEMSVMILSLVSSEHQSKHSPKCLKSLTQDKILEKKRLNINKGQYKKMNMKTGSVIKSHSILPGVRIPNMYIP